MKNIQRPDNSRIAANTRIYCRSNSVEGLTENLTAALALAVIHGITVTDADVITEHASAASISARPCFRNLLSEIAAGRVKRLVVTDWDRLTRNHTDVERIEDALERGRVTLITSQGIEDYSVQSPI